MNILINPKFLRDKLLCEADEINCKILQLQKEHSSLTAAIGLNRDSFDRKIKNILNKIVIQYFKEDAILKLLVPYLDIYLRPVTIDTYLECSTSIEYIYDVFISININKEHTVKKQKGVKSVKVRTGLYEEITFNISLGDGLLDNVKLIKKKLRKHYKYLSNVAKTIEEIKSSS